MIYEYLEFRYILYLMATNFISKVQKKNKYINEMKKEIKILRINPPPQNKKKIYKHIIIFTSMENKI